MFEDFKTRMARNGSHMGRVLKNQSDMIMDATFTRDIAFRKCYLLKSGAIFPAQNEIEYRKAKNVFFGRDKYEPEKMSQFEEIDCKYLVHTYASLDKDAVDYYLQFRPNAHGSNPNIRVGALVFIPDDMGEYNLWMIAARDDRPQFPQWYVLQCDWLLKWNAYNSKIQGNDRPKTMFQWAVSRSQNSYNSGLWQDYIVERVENQRKIWLPSTPVTDKIWYDTRVFIDSNFTLDGESVAWKVSKVERTAPLGVSKFTMIQELYDNEDWSARIIDTYETTDQPDVTLGLDYYWTGRIDGVGFDSLGKSEIKYSGKGTIRVGYSKKFTAHFYNSEDGMDISENAVPQWEIVRSDGTEFKVVDFDQLENLTCKLDESGDELTVKCKKDYNLIGSTFLIRVKDTNGDRISTVEVEVTG